MSLGHTGLTPEEQHIWRMYLDVSRLIVEHVDRRLQQDARIRPVHYALLARLAEAPHRQLRMAELAERAGVSPSRLSHAMVRLEYCGWVRRETCTSDRRGQLAVLTEEGHTVVTRTEPLHSEAVRQALFGWLSSEQRQALGEITESLARGLRRVGRELVGTSADLAGRTGPDHERGALTRADGT
ncbi:MarR family winged helix-turn-helix transcriptional regulator [Streptomyces sp. NPDC013978]|uniref:MarR family winged helix-turn-helix transcriptional regulator n=1 Tax=Streptomyces sp. NPDC013978 TaxID=3364869 RepID=UPI0036FD532D